MSIRIAHASISENGTINGKKGDQTEKEVCIRDYYNKGWTRNIRFKNPEQAEKVAEFMEKAVKNNHIGYGQSDRNSLLLNIRDNDYDVTKLNKDVNCDCSSIVSCACIYAGAKEKDLYKYNNCATTTTLESRLLNTNLVNIYKDKDHISNTEYMERGDILLKPGSHVVVVLDGNKKVEENYVIYTVKKGDSLWNIAKEFYGNGNEYRKIVLNNNLTSTVIKVGQKLRIYK